MDRTDYNNMTNTELKLCIETIQNEFEAKKQEMIKLCEDMKNIQNRYNAVNAEINIRKIVF